MSTRSDRRPENLQYAEGRSQLPTNERGPGARLSSGPEQSLLTNRPVIVTQSDPSPTRLPLKGSPYSSRCGALKEARSAAAQASLTNAVLGVIGGHRLQWDDHSSVQIRQSLNID